MSFPLLRTCALRRAVTSSILTSQPLLSSFSCSQQRRTLLPFSRTFCSNHTAKTSENSQENHSVEPTCSWAEAPKDPSYYVDATKAGPSFVSDDLVALPQFLTKQEHDMLAKELEPELKRRRWEKGHWDTVINDYREISKSLTRWSPASRAVVDRVYQCPVFARDMKWFNYLHVLDLNATGHIKAHRDNDYCGTTVAGLCLLSPRIMEFRPVDAKEGDESAPLVRLYLEPGMLYVMRRTMRYDWAHAVLGGVQSWKGRAVSCERRISLMFRDAVEINGPLGN
eukprot:comp16645_c0_seq1/m.14841 comp16645_c0_seq1/g.14841  ORF comp16645_c0_seq1/g.14841 comp16645_c0_seq1/m.14841 type:complete len:282 (-) comp16645_c0_seq1:108-953(-)